MKHYEHYGDLCLVQNMVARLVEHYFLNNIRNNEGDDEHGNVDPAEHGNDVDNQIA